MVDSVTVQSENHFVDVYGGEDDPLDNNNQRRELFQCWKAVADPDTMFLLIPEWFSGKELDGKRRPFLFGTVEHDDPDSGAVLFSDLEMLDPSFPINQALEQLGIEHAMEVLDISKEDDYIEDSGKMWIPRSLLEIYEPTTEMLND